jgi:hypothetical protein
MVRLHRPCRLILARCVLVISPNAAAELLRVWRVCDSRGCPGQEPRQVETGVTMKLLGDASRSR